MDIPTREDTYSALLALLPRGRAWQSHDIAIPQGESVLRRFWYAISGPVQTLEQALADTLDEFFASTSRWTGDRDLWMEEYGLPDPATGLSYDDLMAKVSATGGTSVAYYQEWAARAGYATEMRWLKGDDPSFPGVKATLYVRVITSGSSAIPAVARAGAARAGAVRMGAYPATKLERMLHNLIPAHSGIIYEVT